MGDVRFKFVARKRASVQIKHQTSYIKHSSAGSLASTYRFSFRLRQPTLSAFAKSYGVTSNFKASFCLEIFHFPLLPRNLSGQLIGKVKDQAERVISTPELNMLPCLHPEPINVVVYHDPSGSTHLGIGLGLNCFQSLSLPNIATQHCS